MFVIRERLYAHPVDYWKTGCAGKLTVTQHSAEDILPSASENGLFNALKLFSEGYKALSVTTSRVIVQQVGRFSPFS